MGCRKEDRREYRNSNGYQTSFPPQSPQAEVLLLREFLDLGQIRRGQKILRK